MAAWWKTAKMAPFSNISIGQMLILVIATIVALS